MLASSLLHCNSEMELRHSLQEKLIARTEGVRAGGDGAVQVDERVVLAVLRPQGQARSVGIAGSGEVGPVAHHLLTQCAILGTPDGAGTGVERGEDILDLAGGKGEGRRSWGEACSSARPVPGDSAIWASRGSSPPRTKPCPRGPRSCGALPAT